MCASLLPEAWVAVMIHIRLLLYGGRNAWHESTFLLSLGILFHCAADIASASSFGRSAMCIALDATSYLY